MGQGCRAIFCRYPGFPQPMLAFRRPAFHLPFGRSSRLCRPLLLGFSPLSGIFWRPG